MIKMMKELKRHEIMRRIEQQDGEQEQYLPAQTIPRRGTGFQPVENMAKMAMPLDQAYPSVRDEAATRKGPPAEEKVDLKKQSQFVATQVSAKTLVKGDYDIIPACRVEENKANQACPEQRRMEPNICRDGFRSGKYKRAARFNARSPESSS